MALHSGSSQMAHNLDRFSFSSDFELVAGDAARLGVTPRTVRMYRDWYGEQPVTVVTKAGMQALPAYEAELRRQVLGDRRLAERLTQPGIFEQAAARYHTTDAFEVGERAAKEYVGGC